MIDIATIEATNGVLAIFGVLSLIASAYLLYDMTGKMRLTPLIRRWGVLLALVTTTLSMLMTLVYSEVFGLIPCGLCWIERIMLFSQVFIMGSAWYLRDRVFAPFYGIVLSALGLIVSLYHHYLQMGGTEFIKCPAAGAGVSCAKRFMFELGFITFPLMAAILFGFLIVLYLYIRKAETS